MLRRAQNEVTFLNQRVEYLESRNRDQMEELENLQAANATIQKMGEENNRLLELGNQYMEKITSSCKKVSKRASKIKKSGEILTEASNSGYSGVAEAFIQVRYCICTNYSLKM